MAEKGNGDDESNLISWAYGLREEKKNRSTRGLRGSFGEGVFVF